MRRDDVMQEREAIVSLDRSLLEALPGGVVYVEADGAIRAANAPALALLGLSYDKLTSRFTQDFEPETIREDGTPCPTEDYPVTRALVSGEPQPATTIGVRRPSGEVVWCVFTAQPVRSERGEVAGAVVSFMDITERMAAEEASRKSARVLKSILENVPSIIVKTDLTGNILFTNRVSEGMPLDVTAEQVTGESIFSFVNERDHELVRRFLDEVVATGRTLSYELKGLDDVDPNWYATRVGPVLEDGRVVELLYVVTNITASKEAEREREALRAQLNAAQRLEALGRLAGGIAHDFNNVLTVIQGHVDLVRPRVEGTSMEASIRAIADGAGRAASMTQQLLAFGRYQELEPQYVRINDVVMGVHDMLSRLLGEDLELVLELGTDLGHVFVDRIQLERVVVNLAINGRDAMRGGGRLVVRTRAAALPESGSRPAGDYVLMDVVDAGTGLDPETQRRMFEPFFTTKDHREGTGLGLATVHGIVKQSGGDIEVVSSPTGTRVTVLLPRMERPAQPAATRASPGAVHCGNERVLLVEDASMVRRVVRQILADAGYEVHDVSSALSAVETADDALGGFQLLLTDVVMPKMSGPELARRLKARAPDLKVLFMSGWAEGSIHDRGLETEDVMFVTKPFTSETLLRAVRTALDR